MYICVHVRMSSYVCMAMYSMYCYVQYVLLCMHVWLCAVCIAMYACMAMFSMYGYVCSAVCMPMNVWLCLHSCRYVCSTC